MVKQKVPKQLWDYGLVYEAQIMYRKTGKYCRTSLEKVTEDTPNTSKWV